MIKKGHMMEKRPKNGKTCHWMPPFVHQQCHFGEGRRGHQKKWKTVANNGKNKRKNTITRCFDSVWHHLQRKISQNVGAEVTANQDHAGALSVEFVSRNTYPSWIRTCEHTATPCDIVRKSRFCSFGRQNLRKPSRLGEPLRSW